MMVVERGRGLLWFSARPPLSHPHHYHPRQFRAAHQTASQAAALMHIPITPLRPPLQLHRNVCHTGYMSQVSGSSGGGANDRGRFHRGGKSIMMRDNGRGPPLSKDYRQLLSPGDQWEESRVVESGGGSGGSRSHKNRSYRREGEAEERESRGCAFMDYKGQWGNSSLVWRLSLARVFLCSCFPHHPFL